MNKLIRNTLILSVVWILLLIVGLIYIYGFQRRINAKLMVEVQKKSDRLTDLKSLKNDLSELQNYYARLHYISMKYKGTLASFESPGETFDYIRRELTTTNSTIKLNMNYIEENSFKDMKKRRYELRGTGKFVDIYSLLWFLENGPVFYQIESLTLAEVDQNANNIRPEIDEASFNLTMIGFDRTQGPKITEINRDFGSPKNIANLFKKQVAEKKTSKPMENNFAAQTSSSSSEMHLPRQTSRASNSKNPLGLPEINSSCQVLAITPFSVLIKDANGKQIKLRKGDKILGGNLAELNTQSGQVIFQYDSEFGNKSVILTTQK